MSCTLIVQLFSKFLRLHFQCISVTIGNNLKGHRCFVYLQCKLVCKKCAVVLLVSFFFSLTLAAWGVQSPRPASLRFPVQQT